MNHQIWVFMDHIHKYFAYIKRDGQFFLAFPYKCLFLCFTWFYLAANEFPQKSSGFMSRALTNHKLILIPNQCCNNFGHFSSAYSIKC